jgi:hypothetical protein
MNIHLTPFHSHLTFNWCYETGLKGPLSVAANIGEGAAGIDLQWRSFDANECDAHDNINDDNVTTFLRIGRLSFRRQNEFNNDHFFLLRTHFLTNVMYQFLSWNFFQYSIRDCIQLGNKSFWDSSGIIVTNF